MGQCERVLKYMQDFDTINPLQALGDLGVMRLGARIWDLRHQGHHISRRMDTGKHPHPEAGSYAEDRLEDNNAEEQRAARKTLEKPGASPHSGRKSRGLLPPGGGSGL